MATQLATAAGIFVIAIASERNFPLCKNSGTEKAIDHQHPNLISTVLSSNPNDNEVIGIFDAVSTPQTYVHDLAILNKINGGHLACVHPPPLTENVPGNVKAGMIFAVDDVVGPIFGGYVTAALESGSLVALPPAKVVGRGLEGIEEAVGVCRRGVSGRKVVVEL